MDVRYSSGAALLFAALVLAIPVGCAIEEGDFPEAYADAQCDKLRKCDRSDYESTYESADECEADYAELADTLGDIADTFGGDYDPDAARDCVNAIRGATCEEFGDGDFGGECDDVWE